MGTSDEFLYLGGKKSSTHKLISESYLGKSTPLAGHLRQEHRTFRQLLDQ